MNVSKGVIKVLGICGSLRKSSRNMEALQYMKNIAAPKLGGIEMEIADLSEIPFFNGDLEEQLKSTNPALDKLLRQMTDADAFIFACPEYNYSYTPALKNALDWGSRLPGNVGFKGKPVSLISAGGGMKGSRAQYHIRQVAVFLDLFVLNKPEVFLSSFDGTFDKDGKLTDETSMGKMDQQLEALKELSLKLSPVVVTEEEKEL